MHFLLSLISNLDFKPLYMPIEGLLYINNSLYINRRTSKKTECHQNNMPRHCGKCDSSSWTNINIIRQINLLLYKQLTIYTGVWLKKRAPMKIVFFFIYYQVVARWLSKRFCNLLNILKLLPLRYLIESSAGTSEEEMSVDFF